MAALVSSRASQSTVCPPGTTTTSSRSPSAARCASSRWSYGRYERSPRTSSVGTRDVLEARGRGGHLAVGGDDRGLAVAVAIRGRRLRSRRATRGPRRRARAARSGAGSRRSAGRSARRTRRTTCRRGRSRPRERDVAGEEDRRVEQDELRDELRRARRELEREASAERVADEDAGSRAPTVSTIASRCVSMSHGGSQGEWPWPSRSGARTW